MEGELSEHGHSLKSNQTYALTESVQTLKPSVKSHFGASKQWADSSPSISPHRSCFGSYHRDSETARRCGCGNQHHHGLLWRNVLQLLQGDGSSHPSRMPPSLVTRNTMSAWLSGTAIVSVTFTDDTPGAAHISFGTEPRLSYQAPKPTRINKPNFSSWLQPWGSAGGASTTSEPSSDLL